MRAFAHDLRHALRLLIRQPGITVISCLTLALGIGANAAIFSAVDAVLLRPLPWPEPDRLVMVWEKRAREGVMRNSVSPADYLDWRASAKSFDAVSGYSSSAVDLTGRGEPERVTAGSVSAAFRDVFRISLVTGRFFTTDEEVVGGHRVAVLGHDAWTRRFGANPNVLGSLVTLNGVPHQIVGILEPFEFPDPEVEIWTPLALEGGPRPPPRAAHFLDVYARLRPGVSVDQARAEMNAIGDRLSKAYPETNELHGSHVVSLRDELLEPVRAGLLLLLAAVGFVLLIACVNVANLLLARAISRRREIAVRSALGASRARLAAQGLIESLVLALVGGAAGVLVAYWVVAALPYLTAEAGNIVGLERVGIDTRVLTFTLLLSLGTGALFGMMPAWQLSRQDANESLRDGGRSIAGSRRRLRTALVVAEVALASLLLVGAGLALRSFQAILSVDPGIRAQGVMTAYVTLPVARYPERDRQVAAFTAIEDRLRAIPGVRSTGATSMLPMGERNARSGIVIEGRENAEGPTRAHPRGVTPGYFQTIGITLQRGRTFTRQDDDRSKLVAIVNEEAVRRYWPQASPIGARVRFSAEEDWREIVGVVRDVRHWGLTNPVEPELYLPLSQRQYPWSGMSFVVTASGDPESLVPDMRSAVRAVDRDLVVAETMTMENVMSKSIDRQRVTMLLLAVFGGVALLLAGAGIYGVMSHVVSLRTSEIGIRMTLGAQPSDVLRQIVGEALGQTVAGLAIGLAGAFFLVRVFRAMLFEVSPADPLTMAGVALVLLASALAASYLPARRAMRIDPVTALRSE
jgi:putative ABC transport system permease protein